MTHYHPEFVLHDNDRTRVVMALETKGYKPVVLKFVDNLPSKYERKLLYKGKAQHMNGVLRYREIFKTPATSPYPYAIVFDFIPHSSKNEMRAYLPDYSMALLSAMEKLYSIGYLHRDIKPANTLWMCNSKVVLCDTEFVHPCQRNCAILTDESVGTWPYSAPEVVNDKNGYYTYSFSSELYSFGITLALLAFNLQFKNTLLTCDQSLDVGGLIFSSNDKADLINKLAPHLYSYEDSDNAFVLDLIKKLVHPDPHKRITLATAKKHSFLRNASVF